MHKNHKIWLLPVVFSVMFLFAACSDNQIDSNETEAEISAVSETKVTASVERKIRLGSSNYAVQTTYEFTPVRISNAEWADDMMARYQNAKKTIEFAVYQFSKDGYPKTLKEFVKNEAEEYEAYEISTDVKLNGENAAYYRSENEHDGEKLDGITFVLDIGEEYLEVDFWFISSKSEKEAWKIMKSLEKLENQKIMLENYQLQIPADFYLVSNTEEDDVLNYENGGDSLYLSIRHDTTEEPLSDYIAQQGGSDVTSEEINDISVMSYRSEEVLNGSYHNVLNYIIPDTSSEFDVLSFHLNGITAEKEAKQILQTLIKKENAVRMEAKYQEMMEFLNIVEPTETETLSDAEKYIDKKIIRLGSSPYAVWLSAEYAPARVSNAEWADNMTAHYQNTKKSIEFSVYQFSKEDREKTVKEFIQKEVKEYTASETKTDLKFNGIDAGYYCISEENNETINKNITFVLDTEEEYLKICFLFAFSQSEREEFEQEIWDIMDSLEDIQTQLITLGNFQIELPVDFNLVSNEEGIKAYQNGSNSLSMHIKQGATEEVLSDYVSQQGGSDITDEVINDIPIMSYWTMEIVDGAYHSVWNCVFKDTHSEITTLSFCLKGITAEAEAQDILQTLSRT